MATASRRYFKLMLAGFAATLLPILALNLQLGSLSLGNADNVRLASAWQQSTHGITYAPTLSDTGLFKALRLYDRLPDINSVILGSSTAMGIPATAFPPALKVYNFAQTGHDLASATGEAEWLVTHAEHVKYLLIPLDWSIGFIYDAGGPVPFDLDQASKQQSATTHPVPFMERMRDALSYPRVATLFDIFRKILHAPNPRSMFRQYFSQAESDDYRCPDGTPAKDYDTFYRGTCTGFRFDGSATFANSERIGTDEARMLILSATASSSKYAHNLMRHQGEPNPVMLDHLAALERKAEAKGGKLLLFMPPLLPGLEMAFFRHPQFSATLAHTKSRLNAWAAHENVVILDAGQSEHYGCVAAEFIDEHHASAPCYNKVFSSFWKNHSKGNSIIWPAGGLY